MVYGMGEGKAAKRFYQMPLGEAKNQHSMMYEVNKYSLSIQERPDVQPLTKHFVMERKQKRGKDTSYSYYAESLQEAQAKVAELKAAKIKDLERAIQYHEDQAMYNRGRLAAILKEQHPDAGKVIKD
ncbi:MAG: hypothetical protein EBR82_81405 [Caulobacteraceae bacterium]|nr:hypothetical protein [Caulobacteraceae bacterium]